MARKSFSNTLQAAKNVAAPAQTPQAVELEQAKRKITLDQETGTIAKTPVEKLGVAPPPQTEGVVTAAQPTASDMQAVEDRLAPSGGVAPITRAVAARGVTDIEGATRYDEVTAARAVASEQQKQFAMAPRYEQMKVEEEDDFFDFATASELRNKFKTATSTKDALDNVIATGIRLRENLDETFIPATRDETDLGRSVINTLVQKDLLDTTTNQLKPKVANALTIQLLENIQDHLNKRDERVIGKYNSTQSENASFFFDTDKPSELQGQILNGDYTRGNLARGVIGKLGQTPTQDGITVTGYGDSGKTLTPEEADYLDTLMWNAVKNTGFLEVNADGDTEFYTMSKEAEDFFNNSRELLADIQPERRIDVSDAPAISGQSIPGLERLKGERTGPVSQKSKLDSNMVIENKVKDTLSRMPLKIMEERYGFAMQVVASVIQTDDKGTIIGLANQSSEGFFSNEPWAAMIGLDEKKWQKAYNRALKTNNGDISLSRDQADRVVRREAKKIFQTMIDGDQRRDKVFYNKWFHASSVGRYFVRNTILNYQDSKLVRNFVGSAKRVPLNLNNSQDTGSEILANWKYIIGKNLLTPEEGGVKDRSGAFSKTEDMRWSAIEKATNRIINDPNNPTYIKWYKTGSKLRTIAESDYTNIEALNELVGPEFIDDFQDPAEWGYKFQSLVDFANYVDAKKAAKQTDGPVLFEPLAQTQHDGKQNGIAIQAMQMGNIDLLKAVGLMYRSEEDSVIPEGDIRQQYVNQMPSSIDTVFINSPEKKTIFNKMLQNISDHEERKAIVRLISRTPLMEVSYGKDPSYNQDTVIDFLNSKYGNLLIDAANEVDIPNYKRADMIEDFNKLIENTIGSTLNIKHQKTLQSMGMLWSMMGKTPFYKGPLGTNIFLGSKEWTETGLQVPVPTPEGTVMRPVKTRQPTGSARSARKKRLNQKTSDWELAPPSPYGREVANQLPVISIQQIDAAIMAQTILDVNKNRRDPLFMLPVHDAIITDATSVRDYHQVINKNFVEVNKKYNLANNILNGYNEAKSVFLNTVNPNGAYLLAETGPHRSMHTYLVALNEREKEKQKRIVQPITGRRRKKGSAEKLLDAARVFGWSENGGSISGKNLLNLFNAIENYENIAGDFSQWKTDSETRKAIALKKLALKAYQYN